MKGMANMMKQAQKLQSKMLQMQEELAQRTVEASAGGARARTGSPRCFRRRTRDFVRWRSR